MHSEAKSLCGILGAIVPSPLAKIYFLYLRLWFLTHFIFPTVMRTFVVWKCHALYF